MNHICGTQHWGIRKDIFFREKSGTFSIGMTRHLRGNAQLVPMHVDGDVVARLRSGVPLVGLERCSRNSSVFLSGRSNQCGSQWCLRCAV